MLYFKRNTALSQIPLEVRSTSWIHYWDRLLSTPHWLSLVSQNLRVLKVPGQPIDEILFVTSWSWNHDGPVLRSTFMSPSQVQTLPSLSFPKEINLDFSFHCSSTAAEILKANWCQMPGWSELYFAPNLHTHPFFAPYLHHHPQRYDWNRIKYIWSIQLGQNVYSVLFRSGEKKVWFVQIWTFHPCP